MVVTVSARNEHLIVVSLEPLAHGEAFVDWPLHTTIVPWFSVEDGREKDLDSLLKEISGRHKPVVAKIGEVAMFGPRKDVPVNIVLPSRELTELHLDVFETLEGNGFPVHQTEYCGENYRPHISHQAEKKIYDGAEVRMSKLALIKQTRQKAVGTMVKKLVKEYPLSGEIKAR